MEEEGFFEGMEQGTLSSRKVGDILVYIRHTDAADKVAAKKAINFTAAFPLNAISSGSISNAYNNDTNKIINIGDIVINTQATDSAGIAADFKDYIKQAIISLDDGMLA